MRPEEVQTADDQAVEAECNPELADQVSGGIDVLVDDQREASVEPKILVHTSSEADVGAEQAGAHDVSGSPSRPLGRSLSLPEITLSSGFMLFLENMPMHGSEVNREPISEMPNTAADVGQTIWTSDEPTLEMPDTAADVGQAIRPAAVDVPMERDVQPIIPPPLDQPLRSAEVPHVLVTVASGVSRIGLSGKCGGRPVAAGFGAGSIACQKLLESNAAMFEGFVDQICVNAQHSDELLRQLDLVVIERDVAVAERDVAVTERGVAVAKRDVVIAKRDAALALLRQAGLDADL